MMALVALALLIFDLPATEPPSHVATLIAQLGSPSYREREAAHHALDRLGNRCRTALEAGCGSPDAEVASRCRRLLEAALSAMPTTYPLLPWCDMLPEITRPMQREYLQIANCNQPIRVGLDWPDYRFATRLMVKDWLKAGIARSIVIKVLDWMAERELDYRRRHGMPGVTQ